MTFFQLKSFVFVGINIVRLLSVVAICLALSGELVVIVNDIKGYRSSRQSGSTDVSSSSPSSRLARRSPDPFPSPFIPRPYANADSPAVLPSKPSKRFLGRPNRHLERRERLTSTSASFDEEPASPATTSSARSPRVTSTSTTTTTTSGTVTPAQQESTGSAPLASIESETCAYVGSTSVPKSVGGILFATLSRIFACVVLAFMLLSELPPPAKVVQRFWTWAFPPFGNEYGVGILGLLQLFIGCSMLSHALPPFPTVGGWFLFIVAFLNLLLAIGLGSSIKSLRSIFETDSDHDSSSRAPSSRFTSNHRSLSSQGAAHAGAGVSAPAPTFSFGGGGGGGGGGKKEKRAIFISAPMMQQGSSSIAGPVVPPYYASPSST